MPPAANESTGLKQYPQALSAARAQSKVPTKASATKVQEKALTTLKLVRKVPDTEVMVVVELQASTLEMETSVRSSVSEVAESQAIASASTSKLLTQERKIGYIEISSEEDDKSDDDDKAITKGTLNSTQMLLLIKKRNYVIFC